MKEITEKDLNPHLGKFTKAKLLRMICHIANMANSYTPAGTGAIGDRALMKLNLTRSQFEVRFKEDPAAGDDTERVRLEGVRIEPPPYESVLVHDPVWEPQVGRPAKIVEGSTYWASGKIGIVQGKMDGGWEVKVHFADGFNGETNPRDHVIVAYRLEEPKPEPPPKPPAIIPNPS
jgi:hypothetical protein